MKTIFITISRGSLIRNFFQSGIIADILSNGVRVVVLSPNYNDKGIFGQYKHDNLFFEPLHKSKKRIVESILTEFGKGAVYSKTIVARYKYKFAADNPPSQILYYPRVVLFSIVKNIPGIKSALKKLQLYFYPQKEHDYLLGKYQPDLVFVTDFMNHSDASIIKSAKRQNIKVIGLPKSWDNLSKFLMRAELDRLLVWNDFAKDEAMTYQNIPEDKICVTGVPQHDYFVQENILTREDFCKNLGMDPEKQIIFFGGTGGACDDSEGDYVDLILEFLNKNNIDAQILIRPHLAYPDDEKKFERFAENEKVFIYKSEQNLKLKDRWDITENHQKYLYNSIYHSVVSVNVASTLTLDSLAVGKPVINIKFDTRPRDMQDSVTRFYLTDYISKVASFEGTWISKSKEEFFEHLKRVLIEGQNELVNTDKMKEYFLYKNDQQAGKRIVDLIIKELDTDRENLSRSIKDYSIKELRKFCQATAPNPARESIMGKICRFFSIYTTRFFLSTPITPNWITVLSVLTFFVAIALFFVGRYEFNLLACFFIFLSIIFDGSDGEVARFRCRKSFVGGTYTEPVSHDIQYGLSFFFLGIAFYLNGMSAYYLILGSAASIFKLEFRFLKARFDNLMQRINTVKETDSKDTDNIYNQGSLAKIAAFLNRNFLSSTGFLLTMSIFSLINKVEWSLWFYAVSYIIFWLALFAKQVKTIVKNKF